MKVFLIIFLFLSINSFAKASVKSCTGTVRYCDEFGICTDDYFYLYAYQVTQIRDGELRDIRSRLRIRGALGEAADYQFNYELYQNRVVYIGQEFDLAIPISSNDSVFYRNKLGKWEELCP